ncbi:MAG: hypothetical protein Q8O89_00775 [Nanoarchaeota archaeon]|nr:hypothetical protein [Nanoarchaeota archaeon]
MGDILSSKVREDGKIVIELCLDYEEISRLQGHMAKVHLFSEMNSNFEANLAQRGQNDATKYFLVPRQLRKDLKYNGKVACQRIETKSKIFFVYIIDKLGL